MVNDVNALLFDINNTSKCVTKTRNSPYFYSIILENNIAVIDGIKQSKPIHNNHGFVAKHQEYNPLFMLTNDRNQLQLPKVIMDIANMSLYIHPIMLSSNSLQIIFVKLMKFIDLYLTLNSQN